MRRNNAVFWGAGVGVLVSVVLWAGFWVAVIWAVVHFVKKFW